MDDISLAAVAGSSARPRLARGGGNVTSDPRSLYAAALALRTKLAHKSRQRSTHIVASSHGRPGRATHEHPIAQDTPPVPVNAGELIHVQCDTQQPNDTRSSLALPSAYTVSLTTTCRATCSVRSLVRLPTIALISDRSTGGFRHRHLYVTYAAAAAPVATWRPEASPPPSCPWPLAPADFGWAR